MVIKFKQFFKETKTSSKTLFVLWIVFSVICNFANESKLLEIFDFTVIFLFPAIINELCKNPVFQESNSLFFKFMSNTSIISRVLLQLWAFTSLLSAGSIPQNFLYTFSILAFPFLLPAIIIESVKNPILNKRIFANNVSIQKHNPHQRMVTSGSDKTTDKSIKYISKSRITSIVLFGFTVLFFSIGLLLNLNPNTYYPNNISAGIIFAIITVIIFVISLFSPKTKEEELYRKEQRKKNYKKPLPLQAIGGTILCMIGGSLSFLLLMPIMAITDKDFFKASGMEGLLVGIVMGLIGLLLFILGICYLRGKFVDSALAKKERKTFERNMRYNSEIYEDHNMDFSDACENDYCDDVFDSNDISSIDGMEGHDFEYFCADLLRLNGFIEVNVTKGSGDQGVDILAIKDGIKYAIQCKNYTSALGNTPVQEINAGRTFYNCHVGVVMTNSTFTPGAKALAQATGVLLWDRSFVQNMMKNIK